TVLTPPATIQPTATNTVNRRKRDTRKASRPNFATWQLEILFSWLRRHTKHPYPSDTDKQQLCRDVNLTMKQLNNWFIN
ncbi:uncharacterized protein EV422DRAFT_483669, partial [Fimicolochytrium jonesii]|uniref:uncharacterized protein n=1 Tax=Fimicolochytrium jonesii TaxID=1396493 RepID=UPI0022FDF19B